MPRIQIAILGAGFAGMAAALYLIQLKAAVEITVYDHAGHGGAASKISAGLIHKYSGRQAKLNPFGIEAELESKKLFQVSTRALGRSVILSDGILRLAFSEKQQADFAKCAKTYPDVIGLTAKECQSIDSLLPAVPAILIKSGLTIDIPSYLKGLYKACLSHGIKFIDEHISTLQSLNRYDVIICAAGSGCLQFPELKNLNIHALKGQLLELKWHESLPPLRMSLISQTYLCMSPDQRHVTVGATYEHNFQNQNPDYEKAISELYPKALELYPALAGAPIVSVKSALRATLPGRIPFAGHVKDKIWAFTGLGSRGLLYHAYFAKQLATQIGNQEFKSSILTT